MRIIPVGRRVLVQKDAVAEAFAEFTDSEGNVKKLYKPREVKDTEHAKQSYGTVIAVADEAYEDVYEKKQCGVGDRIVFRAYAGTQASDEDENLILINDQDVLGIVIDE